MKRKIATALVTLFLSAGWLAGQAAQPKAAGAAAKSGAKPAAAAPGAHGTHVVSFHRDILPILQDRCMACHFQKDHWPGMDLSQDRAYMTLVNHKGTLSGKDMLVKPDDPMHSFLMNKLSAKPRAGDPMPPYGMGLSPAEHHLIVQWIQQGAKNN
jgi:uncharacterized membrane protein